jgi:hypothetical protein
MTEASSARFAFILGAMGVLLADILKMVGSLVSWAKEFDRA